VLSVVGLTMCSLIEEKMRVFECCVGVDNM
jgi:hypothetical protein